MTYFTAPEYMPEADSPYRDFVQRRRVVIQQFLTRPHWINDLTAAVGALCVFCFSIATFDYPGALIGTYFLIAVVVIVNALVVGAWRFGRNMQLDAIDEEQAGFERAWEVKGHQNSG